MQDNLFSLKKIETAARLFIPQMALLFFIMLSFVPLPVPMVGEMKPPFVLMVVYYWAIYRPTLVPPALCFVVGLLLDVFSGSFLGVNAIILLLAQMTVRDQRRFLMGQPYTTIWAVFGLVALVSSLLQWGLYGIGSMHWVALQPQLIATGIGLCMFPFVTMLLVMVHKILPVASRAYP